MFPLTELSSSEAIPAPPPDGPCTAKENGSNSCAFPAVNPYLDRWLDAIDSDGKLPPEAYEVASVMALSVGIGHVAFTDWQRINVALGRNRRDLAVFETMSELELEGYLDRNLDDRSGRFGRNYGWLLLIPEGEL